ncbi:MAG: DUF3267 domain-containing protein [Lachnospiraceae bacterium]|nr:DUF3267 domain-containing protein [Lachnospiraceae bacterium]
MRLHYQGKYNMDPASLPYKEHMPGAVKFKEAEDSKKMALIANGLATVILIILAIPALLRNWNQLGESNLPMMLGMVASLLTAIPHEFFHAICFKEDAYIYTNLAQGMLFVVGPETMSKGRFIFMSLLPNVIFGLIPYLIGMIFPNQTFFLWLGVMCLGMGAGDYYNVFNAMTQMPKGARTYLYQFNSYWYMP